MFIIELATTTGKVCEKYATYEEARRRVESFPVGSLVGLPLIFREKETVCATLAAIHAALEPQGRLVCIGVHPHRGNDPESYFTPHEQIAVAKETGLFRLLAVSEPKE